MLTHVVSEYLNVSIFILRSINTLTPADSIVVGTSVITSFSAYLWEQVGCLNRLISYTFILSLELIDM